jgi:hypothetical protein
MGTALTYYYLFTTVRQPEHPEKEFTPATLVVLLHPVAISITPF